MSDGGWAGGETWPRPADPPFPPYAPVPQPQAPPAYPPQPQPPPGYAPQPYGAYGPYQPPPYGYGPPPPRTNGMAVASLVLGIVWVYWVGSILAVVFGFVARSQIKASGGAQTGDGMAIAGIVLGFIGVATLVLFVLLPLLFGGTALLFGAD